jgi:hypothetical protein
VRKALKLLLALGAIGPIALLLSAPAHAEEDCATLMRAIKMQVFDQNWEKVNTEASRLLATYPDCPQRRQAAYLRAQAMDRGGESNQALAAYNDFLTDYCAAPEEVVHCELAQVALYDLAGRLVESEDHGEALAILEAGLKEPGDAGVFAALTLADQPTKKMQSDALPYLKEALAAGLDRDVRNRVCLAILKIEPGPSPCAEPAKGLVPGAPSLISVEVFDKQAETIQLRLNMPVALADAVVRALPDDIRNEMDLEGIDIKSIFASIRSNSMGTIFELETSEMKVRIWLQ